MNPQVLTKSVDFDTTIAINGAATLVAAVAQQTVYLGELTLTWDATVATYDVILQDTSGGVLGRVSTVVLGPHRIDFKSRPLTVGRGFVIQNQAGSAVTPRGTLTYDQY